MTRSDGAVFPISPQSDDSALPKGSAGDSRATNRVYGSGSYGQTSSPADEAIHSQRRLLPGETPEYSDSRRRTREYSVAESGVTSDDRTLQVAGVQAASWGSRAVAPMPGKRIPVVPESLKNSGAPASLSPRESQVMDLLAEGLAYKETAHALNISGHTVKAYLQSCREKLDARNSTHAAAIWTAMKFKRAA